MNSPSLIEAMARAILSERYQLENGRLNTNISWEIIDENTRARYLDQARAALSVLQHHATDNGGFLVLDDGWVLCKHKAPDVLTDQERDEIIGRLLSARPEVKT